MSVLRGHIWEGGEGAAELPKVVKGDPVYPRLGEAMQSSHEQAISSTFKGQTRNRV